VAVIDQSPLRRLNLSEAIWEFGNFVLLADQEMEIAAC
jgi:hypothetical protein